jgi:predicted RNA-binding Zn-ribbon protein involved in translation (DUF1610 family)
MGLERLSFVPPADECLYVARLPVEAMCPECGSVDVARYPVANHLGARMVTKCQECFHMLALDRPTEEDNWPPFRSATHGWPASRAG